MPRLPLLLFAVLVIAGAIFVIATTPGLPDPVASRFGGGHQAVGFMSHRVYVPFMLVIGGLVPVGLVALVSGLVRARPRSLNIPNRDHWLSPARRPATVAYLTDHMCWLGCLLSAFASAIHWLLLEANATSPPRLPAGPFWMLFGGFLAAIAAWIVAIYARFRRPA